MKLDNTTRKLQVLLDATVSTTACDVIVCYRDENRNAPQAIGAVPSATYLSTVSSATVVDMLPAPLVNTVVRVPERISLKNRDTTTRTPTFRLNDNATTYQFWSPQLLTGESAFYDEGQGWYAMDANGNRKESLAAATNWAVSGNLTVAGNTTLGDAAADLVTINASNISTPNRPEFQVTLSTSQLNLAINTEGAPITVLFDTETFDIGSNFNTATNQFTAPYAGKYIFCVSIDIDNFDTATTRTSIVLTTSNRLYTVGIIYGPAYAADGRIKLTAYFVSDMDAADIAYVDARLSNDGTGQADILSSTNSYFSGAFLG